MTGPTTTKDGQIVKQRNGTLQPGAKKTLVQLLGDLGPEIARALPRHVNPDRMSRIALTALRSTPKLAQCTPESFLGCIVQAAQLGLEVNTPLGHAYLIPFEDRRNNRVICQLIVGYQGMIDLARRSGLVKALYAYPVYEGDKFTWSLGLNPNITHEPSTDAGRERKQITHVYAVAKLEGGEPVFTVLTRSEVEKYRDRSRASKSGPWVTDYEAMALKTSIRRLFRWLPKSAEMATAAAFDEALETGRSQLTAADGEVVALLQGQGLDVAGEAAAELEQPAEQEPPTTHDEEPPVQAPPQAREPGED
jgi:recombination protein RecT